jgi:outer membrane lipoprotein SlyB
MTNKAFPVLLGTLLLGGCATYGGYTPTVDPYNDRNAYRIQQDEQECKDLARQAGSLGTETAKGAVAGGLLGAAAGAAIGAVTGNPGKGAAYGAAAGGFGGATHQGLSADEQFKRAYINCMRNRGHNVIN